MRKQPLGGYPAGHESPSQPAAKEAPLSNPPSMKTIDIP